MSVDITLFIKCNKCGDKIYLGHYKNNNTAIVTKYNPTQVLLVIYEFMTEHIFFNNGECCNNDLYNHEAIWGRDEKETGFEIVRENG